MTRGKVLSQQVAAGVTPAEALAEFVSSESGGASASLAPIVWRLAILESRRDPAHAARTLARHAELAADEGSYQVAHAIQCAAIVGLGAAAAASTRASDALGDAIHESRIAYESLDDFAFRGKCLASNALIQAARLILAKKPLPAYRAALIARQRLDEMHVGMDAEAIAELRAVLTQAAPKIGALLRPIELTRLIEMHDDADWIRGIRDELSPLSTAQENAVLRAIYQEDA